MVIKLDAATVAAERWFADDICNGGVEDDDEGDDIFGGNALKAEA